MYRPDGFAVREEHNAFMIGNVGKADPILALEQWQAFYEVISARMEVVVVDAPPVSPDMVFIANAALLGPHGTAVMSNMVFESRRKETRHFALSLQRMGYRVEHLPQSVFFEGQGDALWHPELSLVWGGYGKRSQAAAYQYVATHLNTLVILLELVSDLYHLDTAFCPLDRDTVLYCPEAFTRESNEMIEYMFSRRVTVTMLEGRTFACNAVPIGNHVVMPAGAEFLTETLEKIGFAAHYTPMSELLKSGGANACCVLRHYR